MKKENQAIAEAILFLEHGDYDKRKPYLDKMYKRECVKLKGYEFSDGIDCWEVWKPTDMIKEPQYKGEALLKLVPKGDFRNRGIQNIIKILEALHWTYM